MEAKDFLITLFIYIIVLCNINIEGKNLKINRNTYIKTIYGDTYRCVDFHKQPAFDHPLLKNHSLIYQMKSKRMRDEVSLKNTEFSKMWKNGKGCPLGTVPINTKSSLTSYYPTTNGEPGYHFAGIRTNNNNLKYMGAGMNTTVHDVKVGALQFSGAHVKIQGGSDYIQLGWSVNPNLNIDSRVRSFIFTHTNSAHCYNLLCPGFILVRHDVVVDHVLEPVSQLGGPIYNRAFLIAKDPNDGDWMIVLRNNRAKVGIWPQQIFSGLKDLATNIEWGGIAYSPEGIPSPPMGFGSFSEKLSPRFNAYFMQVEIINENNEIVDAKDAESFADQTYGVSDEGIHHDFGRVFFYGGSGGKF